LPKELGQSTISKQNQPNQCQMGDSIIRFNHQYKKLKAAGCAQLRPYHNVNNAPKLETVEQLAKKSVEAENSTHYRSLGIAIEISSNF
jgi:hypothetical protein